MPGREGDSDAYRVCMGRELGISTAEALIPKGAPLETLRRIARECKACPLWQRGTQTVFGEGPRDARVVLVGEQPGDKEDLEGHPFVGPAGRLLDEALETAGIDRGLCYVTNAVKHFKWVARGKRRLHEKPNAREIAACKPWLQAELEAIHPDVVVALGATAAQTLLGRSFKVTQHRGEIFASELAPKVLATIHPSSILRMDDREERHRELARFAADLEHIKPFLKAK
jgi:DNA polymerase